MILEICADRRDLNVCPTPWRSSNRMLATAHGRMALRAKRLADALS